MWRHFVSDRIIRRTAGGHTTDTELCEFGKDSTHPQSLAEGRAKSCQATCSRLQGMMTTARSEWHVAMTDDNV